VSGQPFGQGADYIRMDANMGYGVKTSEEMATDYVRMNSNVVYGLKMVDHELEDQTCTEQGSDSISMKPDDVCGVGDGDSQCHNHFHVEES